MFGWVTNLSNRIEIIIVLIEAEIFCGVYSKLKKLLFIYFAILDCITFYFLSHYN